MKYFITVFLLLSLTINNCAQAQVVDSTVIRLSEQSYDSVYWSFYTQSIDSFSLGLKKATLTREWNNNQWVNKWLDNYAYSSVADSNTTQMWNGQWDNFFKYVFYHNSQGLDTLIYWIRWNGQWIYQNKFECTYNADSSLATRTTSNWNTSASQWEYYEYDYWSKDSLGSDTSLTTDRYTNAMWVPNGRVSFTYDSVGNLVSSVRNYWNSSDSLYDQTYYTSSSSYDSLNRVFASFVGGIPGGHSHSYYYYYPDNNLSDEWSYYQEMAGDETWTHTHYYIDVANNVYVFLPADYSICANDSIPVGGFAFGGQQPLHYNWSPPGGITSDTIENPYLIADTTTTFYFTVTDANNIFDSDSIQITINTMPVIDSIVSVPASCVVCFDGSFVIYSGMANHYTITPDSGVVISGNTISGLSSRTYLICVGDQNNCTTCLSDSIGNTTGIDNNQMMLAYVSPNPFSTFAEILCNSGSGHLNLEIYDVTGKKVKEMIIVSPVTRISRSNLKDGIYFGVLQDGNVSAGRFKFVLVGE